MRSIILASIVCICSLPAFAQSAKSFPEELRGNWLSPGNNAWKYGFYDHFAMVDGQFWDYSNIRTTRKMTVLSLIKEGARMELAVMPQGETEIAVTDPSGTKTIVSKTSAENPDYAFYERKGFEIPVIKKADFHLSGFVDGYDPEKDNYKFVNVIYNHLLEGDQVVHVAQLDSLGRFSMEIPLLNPQEIMFKFGNMLVGLFAVPGSDLMISVNKESAKLLFAGREGLLNTEMEGYTRNLQEILGFNLNSQQVKELGQTEYCAFRLGKMSEQLTDLEKYSAEHRSSKRFREQMEARIRYSAANDLMRYSWLHDEERKLLSDEYMFFLESTPINNQLALLTHEYSAFINEYIMYKSFTAVNIERTYSFPEILARAKADGAEIDPKDKEKLIYFGNLYEADSAAALRFYEADSVELRRLVEKYGEIFSDAAGHLAIEDRQNSLLKVINKLKDGPGWDVILGRMANELIERTRQPLQEEKLAFYRDEISNSEIIQEIERSNMELQRQLSGGIPSNATIIPSLRPAQDSVLEALISPYKGKVLYIDFWAPWCGPCMAEMPASGSLRQEMSDKDVVFLYLGVNCSKESWENTIKAEQIEGEHYLLSKDEYALLSSRFGISGIPRYMLIDKEGNISDADADRPSFRQALIKDMQALLQ